MNKKETINRILSYITLNEEYIMLYSNRVQCDDGLNYMVNVNDIHKQYVELRRKIVDLLEE